MLLKKKKQWCEANKEIIFEREKQYREANKEKIYEIHKQYREKNREKIKAQRNQKHDCLCGGRYSHSAKTRHERTARHQQWENNDFNK